VAAKSRAIRADSSLRELRSSLISGDAGVMTMGRCSQAECP
jgi:hypothetical protein